MSAKKTYIYSRQLKRSYGVDPARRELRCAHVQEILEEVLQYSKSSESPKRTSRLCKTAVEFFLRFRRVHTHARSSISGRQIFS